MSSDEHNGWTEYSRLVLSELKRLDQDIKDLRTEVRAVHDDVLGLKIKAGLWGAVGAAVPIAIGFMIQLVALK